MTGSYVFCSKGKTFDMDKLYKECVAGKTHEELLKYGALQSKPQHP